ncbi:hypothetical protein [Vitiosangium sp. GDMCC 1.1324]|uniref:hypothetical protein n=1 Tax=Vitiosangium sp. (strain GDMCC 1.1324) TaxID=2138576 RepID=UPI000D338F61|nr:hypothetical protein [Vitiosangium sp. GDMCC 1.1324]PTL80054.1 hypothetical protein DAT35_32090 [Vitiosangium sp. GDMCC 1.1324]
MSKPKIQTGMVVRGRDGEPLGRVISVDDSGFVLEHRVVITREHRMRFEEIHSLDEHGVVLDPEHVWPRHHLEAMDRVEVFWSARRARDAHEPLDAREAVETSASSWRVATTEHAEAHSIQVERGTVRSPRYVPMSEEPSRQASLAGEESPTAPSQSASPEDPPERRTRVPWIRRMGLSRAKLVTHYATHPLQAASSLLDMLRGERPDTRH